MALNTSNSTNLEQLVLNGLIIVSKHVPWAVNCVAYIFNFWPSGILALGAERHSARMSEIKNVG